MTSAENYSFNAEAAFRHVTQRVQELADALHEEQRKHLSMRYVDLDKNSDFYLTMSIGAIIWKGINAWNKK
eukprot:symbB.v1.2.039776.t1/scaffold6401.1/size18394/2